MLLRCVSVCFRFLSVVIFSSFVLLLLVLLSLLLGCQIASLLLPSLSPLHPVVRSLFGSTPKRRNISKSGTGTYFEFSGLCCFSRVLSFYFLPLSQLDTISEGNGVTKKTFITIIIHSLPCLPDLTHNSLSFPQKQVSSSRIDPMVPCRPSLDTSRSASISANSHRWSLVASTSPPQQTRPDSTSIRPSIPGDTAFPAQPSSSGLQIANGVNKSNPFSANRSPPLPTVAVTIAGIASEHAAHSPNSSRNSN